MKVSEFMFGNVDLLCYKLNKFKLWGSYEFMCTHIPKFLRNKKSNNIS